MMVKKLILLIYFCSLFLFVGCASSSKDNIVCKIAEEYNGMTMDNVVTASIENDKVASVSGTFTFDSEKNANAYYTFLTVFEKNLGDDKSLGITLDGNTISVEKYYYLIEYNLNNNEKTISIIGQSKEDYIKVLEDRNFSCK